MLFNILLAQCFSSFPINNTCTEKNYLFHCGELMTCINNTCQFCTNHEQCRLNHDHINYFCRYSSHYDSNICTFEPITHEYKIPHILGAVFVFLLGIIVPLSGIDGGFIFIPLIITSFLPPLKYLASLSSSLLCGSSFISFILNLFQKHPIYQRPLINYNVIAIFEPLSWIGSVFGIILCSILPNWVILCINLIFLLFGSIFNFIIGVRRNMKKYRKQFLFSETELVSFPSPYLGPAYSRFLVLALFHLWIVFMLFPFLRGGDRLPSIAYFSACSELYWLFTFLPLVIYLVFEIFAIRTVRSYPVLGQSADVKLFDYILIVFLSLFSGVFSGLLGFSGEFVKGPLLSLLCLEFGEAHATSQMMMFFTSSVTSLQFIANGILNYKDFFILAGFQVIPSIIGNFLNRKLKDRFDVKGRFLIVISIFCLIGFAGSLYFTYKDLQSAVKDHHHFKLYDFCLLSD